MQVREEEDEDVDEGRIMLVREEEENGGREN